MRKMTWLLLLVVSLTIGCGTVEDKRETQIKSGWTLSSPLYGGKSGQTSIKVFSPKTGENLPLTFGIPLGQVQSTKNIVLTDESGVEIPASFIPLENWATQPSHWTLASTVLSAEKDRSQKRFTIKWGNKVRPEKFSEMAHIIDGSQVTIENSMYSLVFSPSGIKTVAASGEFLKTEHWYPTFMPLGEKPLVPDNGILTVLRDSPSYKKFRFATPLSESLELHQEFDVYAGSRFIRCSMRFINRTLKDIHLEGISPLEFSLEGIRSFQISVGDNVPLSGKRFSLHQRAFDSYCILDGERHAISENERTDVCIFTETENSPDILLVFPYFRGMAAGEKELESIISYDGECLRVNHYNHISPNADVRLRETMARTFTYWLIIDPPKEEVSIYADAAAAMPHVIYDREYITEMGVLQEHGVSHLYDSETLEGALYFTRAMVPRAEYPRCGRGTEPEYDGEGATETNLHAGGMVFGEVFQYFTPEPSQGLINKYRNQLGFDTGHIITGGSYAYRNGDIPLALFQEYLRTGNRKIYDLAGIHTLLFADYAVSHAPVPSEGVGHYYCDWFGNPYVYERFEGLLLGYLVTGETWLLESARAIADFTVRAWKDGAPHDMSMSGNLTGVQSRSPYVAKMNLMLFDITGEKKYLDNAVKLAEWAVSTQEPEGWWVMDPYNTESRSYRCTPIFLGYIVQGLFPLYQRTENPELKQSLLRGAEWYLSMQEDARGSNPGTFPNSYWYGKSGSENNPLPISGNYATSSHAANALLQAYLATGNRDYFYASNATWVGVLNHQTPEGGTPLENSSMGSVWSHVMIESLPHFAAVAEEHELPVVLSTRTGVPGTSFMGKGAAWNDAEFRFELKYRHETTVPVHVFFPAGKPDKITMDDAEITDFTYDKKLRVVSFNLTESVEFSVCEVVVRK